MMAEAWAESDWQSAIGWVMALHESAGDPAVHATLALWLSGEPHRQAAYDEAVRVWRLTGVQTPPVDEGVAPAWPMTPDEEASAQGQTAPPAQRSD